MGRTGLEDLARAVAAASERLSDPRLIDLANVVDLLGEMERRSAASIREGMIQSLSTFLEAVLEDRACGGDPGMTAEEVVHLAALPQGVVERMASAARTMAALRVERKLDGRVDRDLQTCIAGLACVGLHLSDPDQVNAGALLQCLSDVERAGRRIRLILPAVGDADAALEREVAALAPAIEEMTDAVVIALTAHDERVAWRAWRRAGAGAGRLERAVSIGRSMGGGRGVTGLVGRIAESRSQQP